MCIHLQNGRRSLNLPPGSVGVTRLRLNQNSFTWGRRYNGMQAIRFKDSWYTVCPRPYESERQVADIAWLKLKGTPAPYRSWYESERRIARLLANVASE